MVRKNKQSVKQTVNVKVHIGDRKQRKRKNYKRKEGGVSHGAQSYSAQQQPYHPVYIQSGTPQSPDPNPLLQAVQKLNENLVQKHVETPINPLLSKVAPKLHIGNKSYIDSDSDLSSYSGTTSRKIHPFPQQPLPPSPYPSPRDLVPPIDKHKSCLKYILCHDRTSISNSVQCNRHGLQISWKSWVGKCCNINCNWPLIHFDTNTIRS